jgi:hypothetical protein
VYSGLLKLKESRVLGTTYGKADSVQDLADLFVVVRPSVAQLSKAVTAERCRSDIKRVQAARSSSEKSLSWHWHWHWHGHDVYVVLCSRQLLNDLCPINSKDKWSLYQQHGPIWGEKTTVIL